MTRVEAEQRCAELNADSPAAGTRWIVRELKRGEFDIAKLSVPGLGNARPLIASTEAKPKPPQAEDPRPSAWRDAPPFGPA